MPDVLIQWCSLLSLSDLVLFALTRIGVSKHVFYNPETNIICIIEMPRYWTILFTCICYVIKHSFKHLLNSGLFQQQIYLHKLYIQWYVCIMFFEKAFQPPLQPIHPPHPHPHPHPHTPPFRKIFHVITFMYLISSDIKIPSNVCFGWKGIFCAIHAYQFP